ncbi:MAG: VCBS repeat-containing protein, partial [Abditibacteriales bacterium]|nr:VCBS repeat-containing protein [Abditibacteriales bacterium]MDW8365202.1 VCBS repeat-containing protein [Abditibacteriales bacterium]
EVRSPEDAVLVDLDNDGAVDVVSCCEGDTKTIWVHWAPQDKSQYLDASAWKTEPIPAAQGNKRWMFCLPMQVDGRHGVDLVAGAKDAGAQIGWLEAPANPRDLAAWKWHPICEAGWVMSLIASDVDGDGDLDVVASDRKGTRRGCYWLENVRTPQGVSWNVHPIGALGQEVMFLTLTDLDRDGWLDVLTAVRGGDFVYLRRKSRSPIAWESFPIRMPPGAGNGKAVNVGDINRDGKPDIVFTCEGAEGQSCVMWMSYRQSPTDYVWDAHDISGAGGGKFDLVQLLDLDGDGDLDVMTCEERSNLGVVWYENPTQL